MNHVRRRPLIVLGFAATLLAALVLAGQLPASPAQDQGVQIEEQKDPARQPLTTAEMEQVTTALQSVTGNQRVRMVFVDRREEDKDAPTGLQEVDVVLYNYDTHETLSAVVAPGPSPQIVHLTVAKGQPPGLGVEEVEEATQLALAHPTVQATLRAAGFAGREAELIITHLLIQPAAPGDPCSTHRCVVLFFNTPEAVLDVEPVVDLTTGDVEVQ